MAVNLDYSGKVVLITGAASGIGLATAHAFAQAGASLVLADRNEEVTDVAASLRDQGADALGMAGDIADPNTSKVLVDTAMQKWGRLDVAFNNAGVGGLAAPIDEIELAVWHRVIDVNLNAIFYGLRQQVPAMIAGGGGVIVNNSSFCGLRPLKGTSIEYTTAKHGVIGLTRQLALDSGHEGIRCFAICPGLIQTPLTTGNPDQSVDEEAAAWILDRTPQNRLGVPADIANAVRLLCSDDAGFINGAAIEIDGALHLG
ncbi:MAG: SDR family NAD(P)-dependent oxidoreductase [Acidimicrobiales bacterium]|nr:SDR family NAD(P)-dependent oxidoreductase [Acidimicrobiales bacterium]